MWQKDALAEISVLRERAASERSRAAQAAALAARHQAQSVSATASMRPLHASMVALQRRIEARHSSSATLHDMYALRLEIWLRGPRSAARPGLITVVASAVGLPSASVMLCAARSGERAPVIATASDATAKAAHDLEIVAVEGPSAEAASTGTLVRAGGAELWRRWRIYGPAVADLGVRAVVAAPLDAGGSRLGALCAYGRSPVIADETVAAASEVADALTRTVLLAGHPEDSAGGMPGAPLPGEFEYPAVVHQAAGMVAVHCGCAIDIAQDLLTARAFAEDVTVEQVAAGVIRGEIRLCEDSAQ